MRKTLWAYVYQLLPPQSEDQLRGVKALLDREHGSAQAGTRTWTGRIVFERLMTRILVVSDGPEQNRDVNQRLEAELKRLNVGFALTAPMLAGDPTV